MNQENAQSKIIYFPNGHFKKNKQRPLSKLMIATLLTACSKQKNGVLFGPADVKGSFTLLVDRGLIIRKEIKIWEVTQEAIDLLQDMGIKEAS